MSDAGCSPSCQHDSTKDSRSVIILTAMSWLKISFNMCSRQMTNCCCPIVIHVFMQAHCLSSKAFWSPSWWHEYTTVNHRTTTSASQKILFDATLIPKHPWSRNLQLQSEQFNPLLSITWQLWHWNNGWSLCFRHQKSCLLARLKKHGNLSSAFNFPNSQQIGDVSNLRDPGSTMVLHGSPSCQVKGSDPGSTSSSSTGLDSTYERSWAGETHGKPAGWREKTWTKSIGPTSWYCEYLFHEQKSACSTSWAKKYCPEKIGSYSV